jgi:hypothetical protein
MRFVASTTFIGSAQVLRRKHLVDPAESLEKKSFEAFRVVQRDK